MTDSDSPTVSAAPRGDDEFVPRRIGPYKLLERVGEGGMGEVWMAEQEEPVRRRVALKLIKLGMDTKEVVARFEAERQALAMMSHPNIARVYDGGATEQGRSYFVMEYIPGIPINEYCDQERLSTVERLDLFKQVCSGVQHAHQKGVLHRDIKPANILVMARDGEAVPKIIDFGVAKALDHRLTEKTLFTKHGQLIGTPAYMSPEQAEYRGLEIDTRSDVYSMGVLLYELLVGAPPFDIGEVRRAALDEVVRKIKESEPHKPSTHLSTHRGESQTVASKRRTNPNTLIRQIRGDLDWITMKAMEKEIGRRYPSASELSADIDRYLADEPVVAGPPSAAYRAGKFVKKHRGSVSAVTVVFVSLVAGLVVSLLLYSNLRTKTSALEQSLEGLGLDLTLRARADNTDLLDRHRAMIDTTFSDGGRKEAELRRALGFAYMQEGELERAVEQWGGAIRVCESVFPDDYPLLTELRADMADLLADIGPGKDALEVSVTEERPKSRAVSVSNRASQALAQENFTEAERLAAEAVTTLESVPGQAQHLAWARYTLGVTRLRLGMYYEATQLLTRASDAFLDEDVMDGYLGARRLLAEAQLAQNQSDAAEAVLLEALSFCVNTKDKRAFAATRKEAGLIRAALADLYAATGREESARLLRSLSSSD